MTIGDFLNRLDGVKSQKGGWVAKCPAHDDHKPSLSISEGNDGRILVTCHAGCSTDAIVNTLNLKLADLFIESRVNGNGRMIEATYDYRDETGKLLFQAIRYAPKSFSQRRPDGAGGWVYNLDGVRRVLYRLPELMAAPADETVYLVEGEKDVDRLRAGGLVATCSPMGAGKWRDEYAKPLAGRKVVIIPDNDQPGRDHAQTEAQSLHGGAAAVKMLTLSGLPDKGDVSEWLAMGGTVETLRAMADAAPEWQPGAEVVDGISQSGNLGQTRAYACVRMSSVAPERVRWLWKPYLPLGKITLLDGWPGIGKSWLTCKLAAIVTHGGGFPNGHAFEPGNVLMFSAEDGLADTLRPRLDACGADVKRVIALNFLEKDGLAVFDPEGVVRFEATIAEYQPLLVIVDPLFAFTGGAVDIHRANECREVSRILAAIAARQSCSMLCVRHLNKSGGNGSPMRAGIGSIDWLAAARVGLLAGCDPDDESKLAITNYKNNIARKGESLGYRIAFDPDTDEGSFEWIGISDLTAERILSPAHHEDRDEAAQRIDAEEFLRTFLEQGRQEAAEVEKARKAAAISDYALKKAKIALRIKPYKEGGEKGREGAKWYWELPPDWQLPQDGEQGGERPTQHGEKRDDRHLGSNDSDKSSYGKDLTQDGDSNSFHHVGCDEKDGSDWDNNTNITPEGWTCPF